MAKSMRRKRKMLLRKHGGIFSHIIVDGISLPKWIIPCSYCNKELFGYSQMTVDHIIPISKGGGNKADNLCIACHECNYAKADKLLVDFLGKVE